MLAAIIGVTVKLYHRTAEIRETQMQRADHYIYERYRYVSDRYEYAKSDSGYGL